MMLQDHFRPPLSVRRHWHAFHNAWATYIASDLNANELLTRVAQTNALLFNAELYATAYRPIQQNGQYKLDIWQEKLTVGDRLPTLPLWLHGEICLPVELDSIYERTCREQRIPIHTT